LPLFEEVLRTQLEQDHGELELATTRFRLAEALAATGDDRSRARTLAHQALEAFERDPGSVAEAKAVRTFIPGRR
jgi:hypothetical protein